MEKLTKREIGAAVTGLARARGLQMGDLASALDVAESSISRMLRGKQQILPNRLRILADTFEVSVDKIFSIAQALSPTWKTDELPAHKAQVQDRSQLLSEVLAERIEKLEEDLQKISKELESGESRAAS